MASASVFYIYPKSEKMPNQTISDMQLPPYLRLHVPVIWVLLLQSFCEGVDVLQTEFGLF